MAFLSTRNDPRPPPQIPASELRVIKRRPETTKENDWYFDGNKLSDLIKGENNMSKLRTLNLTLVDNDTNLKGKQKIVFQQLGYVSEHTNEQTIQQILMSGDVATALEKHNKVRAEVVDDAILRNTGRDVFLKPVEIWDLEWQVVQVA